MFCFDWNSIAFRTIAVRTASSEQNCHENKNRRFHSGLSSSSLNVICITSERASPGPVRLIRGMAIGLRQHRHFTDILVQGMPERMRVDESNRGGESMRCRRSKVRQ
jgi:hypothetical protein